MMLIFRGIILALVILLMVFDIVNWRSIKIVAIKKRYRDWISLIGHFLFVVFWYATIIDIGTDIFWLSISMVFFGVNFHEVIEDIKKLKKKLYKKPDMVENYN